MTKIVPLPPAGLADVAARGIADKLGAKLGQPVVVENRPGVGGNVGTVAAARSAPDGYTLLLGYDGTLVINPHIYSNPGFDTLKDFIPTAKIGDATSILVAPPTFSTKNVTDLIALAKSKPGEVQFGTAGVGSTPHLVLEMSNRRAGVNLIYILYKGGSQAISDVVGRANSAGLHRFATAQQHVKAGAVVGLTVSGMERSPLLPEVQTFSEAGLPDLAVESWAGLLPGKHAPFDYG